MNDPGHGQAVECTVFAVSEDEQGTFEESRCVILPAPLESTVSYGSGTARGPGAVLEASQQVELWDEELGRPYWKSKAIHTSEALDFSGDTPEEAVDRIASAVEQIVAKDKFPLTLGGEHTVTAGAFRAVRAKFPKAGILIFDAHLDLRDSYGGTPWSHACVARRIVEEHAPPISWCATRSYSQEEAEFVKERRFRPFHAHDMALMRWPGQVVDQLPKQVYLSIDVDGLDPSCMPGTGTPEPGGLSYRDLMALVDDLCGRRQVVGADIVEVAPIPHQTVSEFTAARIAAKILARV